MNEQSLTRLSDYFALSLEAKIKYKTQLEWSTDEVIAQAYQPAFQTLKTLSTARQHGNELDQELVQYVKDAADEKLKIATFGWHMPELNLMCKCVNTTQTQEGTIFVLAFVVAMKKMSLMFSCQASREEVFNSTLGCHENEDSEVEDAWKYYFQHTPCAIA